MPFFLTGALIVFHTSKEKDSQTEAFGTGELGLGSKRPEFFEKRNKHLPGKKSAFSENVLMFGE